MVSKKIIVALFFVNFFVITIFSHEQSSRLSKIKIHQYKEALALYQFRPGGFDVNGESLIVHSIIQPGDLVFDVGANVGDWSQEVLSTNKAASIYAFEPIPTIFNKYQKNIKHTNVNVYNLAISNKFSELVSFYYYSVYEGVLSSLYQRELAEPKIGMTPKLIKVNTETIDHFCQNNGIEKIDFLKIDTEGCEYDVLDGARDLLSKQKIAAIQFEYGLTYKDSRKTLQQVFSILVPYNYVIFKICPDGIIHIAHWTNSLEDFYQSNFLAIASWAADDYKTLNG